MVRNQHVLSEPKHKVIPYVLRHFDSGSPQSRRKSRSTPALQIHVEEAVYTLFGGRHFVHGGGPQKSWLVSACFHLKHHPSYTSSEP